MHTDGVNENGNHHIHAMNIMTYLCDGHVHESCLMLMIKGRDNRSLHADLDSHQFVMSTGRDHVDVHGDDD